MAKAPNLPNVSNKERRKYDQGRLVESTLILNSDTVKMTTPGPQGLHDKWLILSYYADQYKAMTIELRKDISALVRKKENVDAVWFNLLALNVYTKKLTDREKEWSILANGCMIFLR